MKSKLTFLTVGILTLSLLAGCAANAPAPIPEGTQEAALEVIATAPETTPATTAPVVTEAPAEVPTEAAPYEVTVKTVITEAQTTVTVTTADEFLAAIAPNTEIVVDAELIDFSTASDYGKGEKEFYQWREEFDGPGLYIRNVSNLTIRGASDDHNATVLSVVPRYAHVLSFENCSNIHLKGFTAGHTKEPGSCMGGVLSFVNSQDVLVEDCGLFGCGTWGVWGQSSMNIQVANSEIYECSTCGLYLTNCRDIQVDGTTFRDLGDEYGPGSVFRLYECENITCNGEEAVPFLTIEELGW